MIAILLQILKIIGIVLLVLIALVLILTCLILFGPIRFQIEAAHEDNYRVRAKVSWIGIISAIAGYDQEMNWSVRIFGIQILPPKPKKKKDREKHPEEPVQIAQVSDSEKNEYKEATPKEADTQSREEPVVPQTKVAPDKMQPAVEEQKTKQRKKQQRDDKEEVKQDSGIKRMISHLKHAHQLLTDEGIQYLLEKIKETIIYILGSVKWKEGVGDVDFSLGSPETTGYLTGIIAMFPFMYGKKLSIRPDFFSEDIYMNGNIRFAGSITLIHFAIAGIRLIKDRKIRKSVKKLLN